MLTDSNNFEFQRKYWRKKKEKEKHFPSVSQESVLIVHIYFLLWTQCWVKEENQLQKRWYCSFFKLFWGFIELSVLLLFFCLFICSIFRIEGSCESKPHQLIYNASQQEDSEEVLRFLSKFVSSHFESWCLLIQTKDSTFNILYPNIVPYTIFFFFFFCQILDCFKRSGFC